MSPFSSTKKIYSFLICQLMMAVIQNICSLKHNTYVWRQACKNVVFKEWVFLKISDFLIVLFGCSSSFNSLLILFSLYIFISFLCPSVCPSHPSCLHKSPHSSSLVYPPNPLPICPSSTTFFHRISELIHENTFCCTFSC